ncbi:MAG: TIGR02221 family CRISPR-associated protein [Clostridium sp.]|nr:TIGR02221 family CRISPR-associated protein [Bacteroides sp.]MCM1563035.1 TIGR02221 family CRISPR-associated protein [Clostridium sp.]
MPGREETGLHFITVLGTSCYFDCVYEMENTDFAYNTPFVQAAVLKYITCAYGKCDRVTVLLTDKSEERNWYTREYTENECQMAALRQQELGPGERKIGLKEILETEFSDVDIECVKIREGRNKAEIDEIFEAMYDCILPEETICFDFTHGLRNIPMQALTVIHYAKALKNIRVGGMYYGAFELGERKEDGKLHVNLSDMSACSTILDWTGAAESFIKGGSANQIKVLYERTVRPGKEESRSRKTMAALCNLTNCLGTSRGKRDDDTQKSIRRAYEFYKEAYGDMREHEKPLSEVPLLRLFDKIEEDVDVFGDACYVIKDGQRIDLENTATGMAAVEWAVRKNLIQQGFTALEETIKTYVCETYGISPEDEFPRDMVVGRTVKFMLNELKEQRKLRRDEEIPADAQRKEWAEKRVRQFEEECRHSADPGEDEKAYYIDRIREIVGNLPLELVNLTGNVSMQRNSLNHFGFQKEVKSYKELQRQLGETWQKMREIMEADKVVWYRTKE